MNSPTTQITSVTEPTNNVAKQNHLLSNEIVIILKSHVGKELHQISYEPPPLHVPLPIVYLYKESFFITKPQRLTFVKDGINTGHPPISWI